jgi:hypothetical protein
VFIVGTLADGDPRAAAERAGEVLAVDSGCDRHLAKGGQEGASVARSLTTGSGGGRYDKQPHVASISGLGNGGPDDNDAQQGRLVANTLGTRVRHAHGDGDGETIIAAPLTKA